MTDTMSSQPTRRLVRSTTNRRIAGVSGGLGDYFGIDPVLFRIGFVVATFAGGSGILAYIIAWLVLPEDDGAPGPPRSTSNRQWTPPLVIGALLVLAGVVTLLDSSSWFGFDLNGPVLIWPLGLLIAGGWLIARERSGVVGAPADGTATDVVDDEGADSADDVPGGDPEPWSGLAGASPPPDDGATATAPTAAVPGPVTRTRRFSPTRLTLGALLIFGGLVGLGHLFDWFTISLTASLAVALLITGGGLIAGAIWGGGWPLLPLGLLIGLALTGSALAGDVDVSGGTGESLERPLTVESISDYRWGIGHLTLDLRELADDLEPGETAEIAVSQGIGFLEIIVPDDIGLVVEGNAGIGEVEIELPGTGLDTIDEGIGAEIRVDNRTEGDPTVSIDADIDLGRILVTDRDN